MSVLLYGPGYCFICRGHFRSAQTVVRNSEGAFQRVAEVSGSIKPNPGGTV